MAIFRDTTIKIDQVQQMTGLDKQGIFAAIRDEGFPRPTMRGTRIGGWPEPLVRQWVAEHPRSVH